MLGRAPSIGASFSLSLTDLNSLESSHGFPGKRRHVYQISLPVGPHGLAIDGRVVKHFPENLHNAEGVQRSSVAMHNSRVYQHPATSHTAECVLTWVRRRGPMGEKCVA